MIEGNRVEVYLSDELKAKKNLFKIKKDARINGGHDKCFKFINSYYDLKVNFADISNLSIYYSNNGHLSFSIATPWLLISIPEVVSNSHLEILNSIMEDLDGNALAIYAYINNVLEQYIIDDTYKDNKDMLIKVLKKKKLV